MQIDRKLKFIKCKSEKKIEKTHTMEHKSKMKRINFQTKCKLKSSVKIQFVCIVQRTLVIPLKCIHRYIWMCSTRAFIVVVYFRYWTESNDSCTIYQRLFFFFFFCLSVFTLSFPSRYDSVRQMSLITIITARWYRICWHIFGSTENEK